MSEPLPTIGYISHIVADALRDPTSGINTTQLRAEPNGCVSEPLVFRSDALAKLAEKDAEITRLRGVIALFSEYEKLMDNGEDAAAMMVYADLQKMVYATMKGPEA